MKPLGRKSYGSIPHLPGSRLGPKEHKITDGQTRILTEKARDKHDIIIVQEKLDGSCCSVAKVNGEILALTRAGYLADTSPFPMHHVFSRWVEKMAPKFKGLLMDGERICGEWMYQAHGTKYKHAPAFYVFDLFNNENQRMTYTDMQNHLDYLHTQGDGAALARMLNDGGAMSIESALERIGEHGDYGADLSEGAVWRVERKGKVDFLAKFVRHEKQDGIYLKGDPIYNGLTHEV